MPVIIVVNSDVSAAAGEKAHGILCQTICDPDILVNDKYVIPVESEGKVKIVKYYIHKFVFDMKFETDEEFKRICGLITNIITKYNHNIRDGAGTSVAGRGYFTAFGCKEINNINLIIRDPSKYLLERSQNNFNLFNIKNFTRYTDSTKFENINNIVKTIEFTDVCGGKFQENKMIVNDDRDAIIAKQVLDQIAGVGKHDLKYEEININYNYRDLSDIFKVSKHTECENTTDIKSTKDNGNADKCESSSSSSSSSSSVDDKKPEENSCVTEFKEMKQTLAMLVDKFEKLAQQNQSK